MYHFYPRGESPACVGHASAALYRKGARLWVPKATDQWMPLQMEPQQQDWGPLPAYLHLSSSRGGYTKVPGPLVLYHGWHCCTCSHKLLNLIARVTTKPHFLWQTTPT